MARIPYPVPQTLPEKTQEFLAQMPDINIIRMISYSGAMAPQFVRFTNFLLNKTRLDPILREIAIVRVGFRLNSVYELFQHKKLMRDLGCADELINSLQDITHKQHLSKRQQLVVRATDELIAQTRLSDEVFSALQSELEVGEIQELIVIVGTYMMVCRFLETFEIEIEDDPERAAITVVRGAQSKSP